MKTALKKTAKVFTRRDSATAELRKMGIPKEAYGNFINVVDGKFHCDIAKATLSLVKATENVLKNDKANRKLLPTPVLKRPITPEDKEKIASVRCAETTMAGLARKLILDGMSNDAIFIELQINFGIGDKHKSYPAWYRSQLTRLIGPDLVPTNKEAQYYEANGGKEAVEKRL